jgi:hypothetical protein
MKNNTGTNFDVRGGPEHQTESPKAQGETRLENTVRNEAKGLASASADAEPNEPDTNARNEAAEGLILASNGPETLLSCDRLSLEKLPLGHSLDE